ncbi:MAG: PD-(D/E)XK nuclease family protein [Muribaculaceae bacterium]|nr:PD-(D/E)XK nuclease family protein [Muribaculaceae bacterium]
MTDFVEMVSGRVIVGRIELLFILYRSYLSLQNRVADADIRDFDRFRRWGETALSDFNEVDMQDVDPDSLFKNVKDIKEISSNFLTDEQLKVMEEFFGQVYEPEQLVTEFWKDFSLNKDDDLHKKFIPIWQMMAPLYHAFKDSLEKSGMINSGGAYRLAADILEKEIPESIVADKIAFVGFNALTRSETRIFDALASYSTDDGESHFADFFWDIAGPVINDSTSSAGRYVKYNSNRWPSPQWAVPYLSVSDVNSMPESMRVIAIPSNSLQAKAVGDILENMKDRLNDTDFDDAKVAVVLPDEGLLIPLLYSLPDSVEDVNLTMGYPLKLAAVATFVSLIKKLQGSRRRSGDAIGYYFKDFEALISHPFSISLFGHDVIKVKEWIKHHHHAVIYMHELRAVSDKMSRILHPFADDASAEEVALWLDNILNVVAESITFSDIKLLKSNVDVANIEFYRKSIRSLLDLAKEYDISMQWFTFMAMADRLVSAETVNFEGKPLSGLQVMGMLETRALDFERIIIPSLNERILPVRRRVRTFISDSLRRAYGLPPVNYSESIFAYYFFRMIARAKEVVLLYDSRSSEGARSGDVSRYVLQLQYLYAKDNISFESWSFDISKSDLQPYPIAKTPHIMDLLSSFTDQGSEGRNLSATALTKYAGCPIRFYFEHLLRIHTDVESVEYIDAITQGNILHFVMQNIYLPEDKQGLYLSSPELIDAHLIKSKKENVREIDRLVRIGINKMHFHRPEDKLNTPLRGSVAIVAKVLRSQILKILDFDLDLAPFLLYGVEIDGNVSLRMPSGKNINMRFAIDRLDKVTVIENGEQVERMRIVDYKTGSVHVEADSMDSVFEGEMKGKNLIQLWLYANLFDSLPDKNFDKDGNRPVLQLFGKDASLPNMPMVLELYDVNSLKKGNHTYPKIDGVVQVVHEGQNDDFLRNLEKMLCQIFNPDEPFYPTSNLSSCSYCQFKTICWR